MITDALNLHFNFQEIRKVLAQQARKRFAARKKIRDETEAALESKVPTEVDTPERSRVRLASIAEDDGLAFERIINQSDLFPIAYLEMGLAVGNAVCRIELCDRIGRIMGYGTGFLVSPCLIITNNHVLPDLDNALYSQAEFNYQKDANRNPRQSQRFRTAPHRFFVTSKDLDFTLVALESEGANGGRLADFPHLPLKESSGKALKGEYVSIIQHPEGGYKAVAVRENQIVDVFDQYIHYTTDTMSGASGSPVFNDTWEVVALHHSGVPDPKKQGQFVANEGIRISSIMGHLASLRDSLSAPEKALLDELFYGGEVQPTPTSIPKPPLEVARRALDSYEEAEGYNPDFLDGHPLPLPTLDQDLRNDVALLKDGSIELKYTHFSVVMCASRRLAFFTAVNIDGSSSQDLKRKGDAWYFDPRLDEQFQCGPELYSDNALDRGHLVRRLDPVWGPDAKQANEDTFHFTNCSPQHEDLNQKTWLDLENYILKNAGAFDLKVSVFTGPVFRIDDMIYRGEYQIPAEYWKVVAMVLDNGRLSATAYLQTQKNLITNLEFAYGSYRTYQVPVERIEKLTGLDFGPLRDADPQRTLEGIMGRPIDKASDIRL
jgi:endonuclease G